MGVKLYVRRCDGVVLRLSWSWLWLWSARVGTGPPGRKSFSKLYAHVVYAHVEYRVVGTMGVPARSAGFLEEVLQDPKTLETVVRGKSE